jgi:glycosyltransferase involved in cell wall biosynthesis
MMEDTAPHPTDGSARPPITSISIVIPAFNEEANLQIVLDASVAELERITKDYEIVVVDDNSRDRTAAIADDAAAKNPNIRVIQNGVNLGCHPSELVGLLESRGDVVFFMPADRQIMPDQIHPCLEAISTSDYVCTRRVSRSDVWGHRMISSFYNWSVRHLFRLPARDVNSSVLVRRAVIDHIGKAVDARTAFISVELIVRAIEEGYTVTEVPIEHHPRVAGKATGLNPRDISVVPLNLARFWVRVTGLRRRIRSQARQAARQ